MRIKLDFVTNSSSACYILAIPIDRFAEVKHYIAELNEHPEASNEGVRTYFSASTLKELQDHTNDGPFDWASRPFGLNFTNLSEESYNVCKTSIEMGESVFEVWVDYGVCEDFADYWKEHIIMECS